jgi:hypothetical protein
MKIETRNQTTNNIEDKVIAVNTLHKHINKVTPKIIELLKDNLTLKKDNSLTKKSNDLISKYLGYNEKNKISCYLDTSYNSFGLLTFKTSYKTNTDNNNVSTYEYITEDIYLYDNDRKWCEIQGNFIINNTKLNVFYPRKIKSLKQVKNIIKQVNVLNAKIENINRSISDKTSNYNNFLNK